MIKRHPLLAISLLAMSLGLAACGTSVAEPKKEAAQEQAVKEAGDSAENTEPEVADKAQESATNATTNATEGEAADEELAVPGYKVGEIPPVPVPEITGLGIIESPDAKITLDMTKSISSVPGITIAPVRIENGQITSGSITVDVGENGEGQYSDGDTLVQTDGDGSGQYTDGNIVIQRDSDGSGQYIDNEKQITLQVDADGAGQFANDADGISLQVDANGTGMYSNDARNCSIIADADYASYTHGGESIINNGDGSGKYENEETGLLIENDGEGRATVTLGDRTVSVEAEPMPDPIRLPLLQMVPAVPAIEANSIQITLDSGVLFDVDKYDIRSDAEDILQALASVLKEADVQEFEIDGHTDSDASDEHNQALSENRANSVKDFLADQGVTANITVNGYGESRPVASNDTAEGKQKNRRVEILIPVQ